MKKSGLLFGFILIVFAVILYCCEKDEEDIQPPDCNIILPADSSEFQIGDTIIQLIVEDTAGGKVFVLR